MAALVLQREQLWDGDQSAVVDHWGWQEDKYGFKGVSIQTWE